jgi:hypothetical protein
MAQQTATEWLIEQVKSKEWQDMFIWHKEEVFNQALQMEKQQIIDAVDYTYNNHDYHTIGELYYIQTFKTNNNGKN